MKWTKSSTIWRRSSQKSNSVFQFFLRFLLFLLYLWNMYRWIMFSSNFFARFDQEAVKRRSTDTFLETRCCLEIASTPWSIRGASVGLASACHEIKFMVVPCRSPFLELSQLAAHNLYGKEDVPCGGIITGIGRVSGWGSYVCTLFLLLLCVTQLERVVIFAESSAWSSPTTRQWKEARTTLWRWRSTCAHKRLLERTFCPAFISVRSMLYTLVMAYEDFSWILCIVDSGGANLPRQEDVFPDKNHFGRIFFNQANLSSQGIPQVCFTLFVT